MDLRNFRNKMGGKNEVLAAALEKRRDTKIDEEVEKNIPVFYQYVKDESKAWRDELGDITRVKKKGMRITDDDEEGTVKFANNTVIADDYLYTNVQLNHDRDPGSAIYPHLHFFQTSADIPNFVIYYRWQVNLDQKVDIWQKLPVLGVGRDYTEVDRTMHQVAFFGSIESPGNDNISDIVQFRIYRDTNNDSGLFEGGDSSIGDVHVLSFDLHLYQDSWGSWGEYTKYKGGIPANDIPGPPRSSVVAIELVDPADFSVVTSTTNTPGSGAISIKSAKTYGDVLDHIKTTDNSPFTVRFLNDAGDSLELTDPPTNTDVVEITAEDGLTVEAYVVTAV